jgi:L-rhamnose isomerase
LQEYKTLYESSNENVVILNDEVRALTEEVVRGGCLERVHFALDYFDASMNRIGV